MTKKIVRKRKSKLTPEKKKELSEVLIKERQEVRSALLDRVTTFTVGHDRTLWLKNNFTQVKEAIFRNVEEVEEEDNGIL